MTDNVAHFPRQEEPASVAETLRALAQQADENPDAFADAVVVYVDKAGVDVAVSLNCSSLKALGLLVCAQQVVLNE